VIRGRRVDLRPVEEEDLPHLHRWQNRPEVWRALALERPQSLDEVRDEVAAVRLDGHAFVVTVDGAAVGRIDLRAFRRRDRICSLSMYLGEPDALGHGHGRDAIMTLLAYAFDRHDLHQVELATSATNEGLIEVAERCGFVREAALRDRRFQDGAWVDLVVLSVRREEFGKERERWDRETT
jgi:ribosomal-protein-alanine N-acetyltransferase